MSIVILVLLGAKIILAENTFHAECDLNSIENVSEKVCKLQLEQTNFTEPNMELNIHVDVDNVIRLSVYHQVMHFIPKIIQPMDKIQTIKVVNTGLLKIKREDLKQFKNLLRIYLMENRIERLEANLFEFNTKILLINFSSNRIKFIHERVFTKLSNLNSLELMNNTCINDGESNKDAMNSFVKYVSEKCSCKNAHVTKLQAQIEDLQQNLTSFQNDFSTRSEGNDEKFMLLLAVLSLILLMTFLTLCWLCCSKFKKTKSSEKSKESLELKVQNRKDEHAVTVDNFDDHNIYEELPVENNNNGDEYAEIQNNSKDEVPLYAEVDMSKKSKK